MTIDILFRSSQLSDVKIHPVLPAEKFQHGGKDYDITMETLTNMVNSFKSGMLGPRLPVTLGHPPLEDAPADGWITDLSIKDNTLFAAIEWLGGMADKIKSKAYGFLSAVFTMNFTDQNGIEHGPALLAAGVTNSPHWKTQPELWAAFAARLTTTNPAPKAIGDAKMEKELEELKAKLAEADKKIVEMTAQLQAKEAEVVKFTTETNDAKAHMTALAAKVDALTKAEQDRNVNDAIKKALAEFRITPAQTAEFTKLAQKDLAQFTALVATMEPRPLPTAPVGSDGSGPQEMTPEKIIAFCKAYSAKNNVLYGVAYDIANQLIAQNKPLVI